MPKDKYYSKEAIGERIKQRLKPKAGQRPNIIRSLLDKAKLPPRGG